MLKRVIDNLVSNIRKYADRKSPVIFRTEREDNRVLVTVSNAVAAEGEPTESTRIGLRTCVKIMEALGGSFQTRREEGRFTASFTLTDS